MTHRGAESDMFLEVCESFWRACPPQRPKLTFWIRQWLACVVHLYFRFGTVFYVASWRIGPEMFHPQFESDGVVSGCTHR